MRPSPEPACVDFPVSSSRWMRVRRHVFACRPRASTSRRRLASAACRTARSDNSWACPDRSSSCGRTSRTPESPHRTRAPRERCARSPVAFGTGSAPGMPETDRTDLRVRFAAELVAAAAEHLRLRLQLDVTLDADDGFVFRVPRVRHSRQRPACARARAWSRARRRARRRAAARSAKSGAASCRPSGIGRVAPSGVTQPHGTESAGKPASDIGIV